MRKPLPVFVYRSKRSPEGNFGDVLSPWLIERVFGLRCVAAPIARADLVAIGSVLDWCHARRFRRLLHGRTLTPRYWGTGTASDGPSLPIAPACVLAVRGPRTQQRIAGLAGRTVAHGDPGLLLSELPVPGGRSRDIVIVPHLNHRDSREFDALAVHLNAFRIDVGGPLEETIAAVRNAALVISSSLHGLVTAAAYGCPFIWCQPTDRVALDPWKFVDFLATLALPVTPRSALSLFAVTRDELRATATSADMRTVAALCAGLRAAFRM